MMAALTVKVMADRLVRFVTKSPILLASVSDVKHKSSLVLQLLKAVVEITLIVCVE